MFMGIQREFKDTRPPEVKSAYDKITIGYLACSIDHAVFLCTECGRAGGLYVTHTAECSVGKVIDGWVNGPEMPYWMHHKVRDE